MYVSLFLFLNRFPKLIILFCVVVSVFFWRQVEQKLYEGETGELIIDSTVEPFIARDSGAYKEFLKVREAFGNEDVLVIALHNPDYKIGLDFLDALASLSRDLPVRVPGVIGVTSLFDIPQPPGTCSGKSYFHQLDYGSYCVSTLEKFRHARSCRQDMSNKGVVLEPEGEVPSTDDELDASLEEDVGELFSDDLDQALDEDFDADAGMEEETFEDKQLISINTGSTSGSSQSQRVPSDLPVRRTQTGIISIEGKRSAEELRKSGWVCTEDLLRKPMMKLREEAEKSISEALLKLSVNPLIQGDLISTDLHTAALVVRFGTGVLPSEKPIQESLLTLLKEYRNRLGIVEEQEEPSIQFRVLPEDSGFRVSEGALHRLLSPHWMPEVTQSEVETEVETGEESTPGPDLPVSPTQTGSLLYQAGAGGDTGPPLLSGIRVAYAGQSRQVFEASRLIREDVRTILPLSLLLIVVVLLLSFRSVRTVSVPLMMVMLGVLWTAGTLALRGDQLNLVTMACAPIIICVGSAYVIKLINQYQSEYRVAEHSISHASSTVNRSEIVRKTVKSVAVPVSVTALTTVAGFAALMISPIPAIQQLGLYSSVGIIVINFFALTLAPAILHYLHIPVPQTFSIQADSMQFIVDGLKDRIRSSSRYIIRIWIGAAAFAAVGMLWIYIDSSTRSFPDESPLVQDLELVENQLAGTDTLRLVFRAQENRDGATRQERNLLKTAETILGIQSLQQWLMQTGGPNEIGQIDGLQIDKVYSPVDYLAYYRSGLDKLSDEEVSSFFAEMRENRGPRFLDDAQELLQMTLRMRVSGSTALLELRDLLEKRVPEWLPRLSVSYTGGGVLASESANNIALGQIQSVFLALAVIFVILSTLFLSWKMGVIALFPNIVAVLIFFGTLGWLNIPIGVTISVIAAIALGIGVDDTIHFLSHYNESAKRLRDKRKASLETLPHVSRPMVLTTFALSTGFILFVLSDMDSQVLFGTLTAYTLLVCLATDMTFLPSVVMETGMITVWDYVGLKFDKPFVESIGLFKGMSVREAKIATLMSYTVDLDEQEVLFRQGDWGQEMYIVLEGSVRIYLEEGMRKTSLTTLAKGTTFGEMGLFRGAQRSATAEAAETCKLLVIKEDSLEQLKRRNPRIATKLYLNLSNRLSRSLEDTNRRMIDKLKKSDFSSLTFPTPFRRQYEDVFRGMSPRKRMKLISHCRTQLVSARAPLIGKRESSDDLVLALSGTVEIRARIDNREVSIAARKDGDLIGEGKSISGRSETDPFAVAVEEAEILLVHAKHLESLRKKEVRATAQFTENLVCLLSDQLEEANNRLKQVS